MRDLWGRGLVGVCVAFVSSLVWIIPPESDQKNLITTGSVTAKSRRWQRPTVQTADFTVGGNVLLVNSCKSITYSSKLLCFVSFPLWLSWLEIQEWNLEFLLFFWCELKTLFWIDIPETEIVVVWNWTVWMFRLYSFGLKNKQPLLMLFLKYFLIQTPFTFVLLQSVTTANCCTASVSLPREITFPTSSHKSYININRYKHPTTDNWQCAWMNYW